MANTRSSNSSAKEQFVARFRREAEAAGRLRHPNVVDVISRALSFCSASKETLTSDDDLASLRALERHLVL